MPTQSPNFNLYLYNSTTDQSESFINYRLAITGPSSDSNMMKIDTALASHATDITSLKTTRGAAVVNAVYVSPNYYEASGITTITSYVTGMMIALKLDTTSDGTVTLNINNLGIKSLMKINAAGTPINLLGADLIAGKYYLFTYDGTRFVWTDVNAVDKSTIVIDTNGDIAHADTSTQVSVTNTGGDVIQSVTLDGMGHVTVLASATMVPANGWIPDPDTWVYVSATSYKIVGKDVRSRFEPGTKLQYTQTTPKYAYSLGAVMSGSDTLVTVVSGSDYSLASATITSPYYSRSDNPVGFPGWFNWSPTFGGFSANPVVTARFSISGRAVHCFVTTTSAGTSNATTFTMTGPTNAAVATWFALPAVFTNGAQQPNGMGKIDTNGAMTLYTSALGAWGNTGNKFSDFSFVYQI